MAPTILQENAALRTEVSNLKATVAKMSSLRASTAGAFTGHAAACVLGVYQALSSSAAACCLAPSVRSCFAHVCAQRIRSQLRSMPFVRCPVAFLVGRLGAVASVGDTYKEDLYVHDITFVTSDKWAQRFSALEVLEGSLIVKGFVDTA